MSLQTKVFFAKGWTFPYLYGIIHSIDKGNLNVGMQAWRTRDVPRDRRLNHTSDIERRVGMDVRMYSVSRLVYGLRLAIKKASGAKTETETTAETKTNSKIVTHEQLH